MSKECAANSCYATKGLDQKANTREQNANYAMLRHALTRHRHDCMDYMRMHDIITWIMQGISYKILQLIFQSDDEYHIIPPSLYKCCD